MSSPAEVEVVERPQTPQSELGLASSPEELQILDDLHLLTFNMNDLLNEAFVKPSGEELKERLAEMKKADRIAEALVSTCPTHPYCCLLTNRSVRQTETHCSCTSTS